MRLKVGPWTAEEISLVRILHAEGWTDVRIAKKLGRNRIVTMRLRKRLKLGRVPHPRKEW